MKKASQNLDTKTPKVSVIIPVFNTGKVVENLVEKFLKNYPNLEMILVDDGSKDNSYEILESFKEKFDKREKTSQNTVAVYRKENGGASSARNFGIEKATGEYIVFMDSDDDVRDDYLVKLVDGITEDGVDLVTTGKLYYRLATGQKKNLFTNKITEQRPDETFKNYILRLLNSDGRMYSVNNKIFRADIVKNNHLRFDEKATFAEDTRFVLDYLDHIEGVIKFIYEPLYVYNFGTDTSTVTSSSLIWDNWESTYAFVKNWVGEPITKEEKKSLKKLRMRWKVSHALAVARSTKKFSEKTKYLNPILLIPSQVIVKFRR
ncbi:glycosyltransferase family 2 protein [Candidatus Saccharibacteria bacterium]|nr:glycosyltransferase family 2 protein [Candidatus Saccharibacteria bacterium]